MKKRLKNVGVLLALLLTLPLQVLADNNTSVPHMQPINSRFILNGKEDIDPRTIKKIDSIGNELFVKTGVNAYIYTAHKYSKKSFDDMRNKIAFIKSFEVNLSKNLDKPFVLITISLDDKRINLLCSDRLKEALDKDKILNDSILPILASEADKNSLMNKLSVSLLNGYSETADEIADFKGAVLKSTLKGNGPTVAKWWKIFMYTIVLSGLLVYFYALWKDKQKRKK